MDHPLELLARPWPWYVAGPLLGLVVPALLLLGNRSFGLSSNIRHLCAVLPVRIDYLRYDWRRIGGWNLLVFGGIVLGGAVAGFLIPDPEGVRVAAATEAHLRALGIEVEGRLAPRVLAGSEALLTLPGLVMTLLGGVLIGFGTRWAAGCTSGHAIAGLASLQLPSLVATIGFFAGGLVMTHLVLPWLLPALLGAT